MGATGKSVNKKQQRRDQAEQRQRLKPFHDKVRETEKALASERSRLSELEACLADQTIYSDPERKDELTQLIQDQAAVKSQIEALEWEWLEASEVLEKNRGRTAIS